MVYDKYLSFKKNNIYIYIINMPDSFPWKHLKLSKFITSDNAILHYHLQKPLKKPKGTILILLGWSQPADEFSPILLTNNFLRDHYNVYILVERGWNNNLVDYGNFISRYAEDAQQFIIDKKLLNIILIGHSMGISVIWHMISLYGEKNYKGYFMLDQGPVLVKNPLTTDPNIYLELGSIFTPLETFQNHAAIGGPDGDNVRKAFETSMFTKNFIDKYPNIVEKIITGVNNYNNITATNILFDHSNNNYIDQSLIKGIKKTAFLIGGIVSILPYQATIYQKKYYNKCTEVRIYTEAEGGSHLMFVENYKLTNKLLNRFLKKNK